MTTIAETSASAPAARSDGAWTRISAVARLHFVNRWSAFVVPWLIMAFIFAINLTIWIIVLVSSGPAGRADAEQGLQYSGASFYIFVYMAVFAVQTITFTFPFALGYGVTRRHYYLGTALAILALGVLYSAGMTILAQIEQATDGWGLGGRMFTAFYFGGYDAPWWQRFVCFLAIFLFFMFVGAALSTIYMRWRMNGMLLFGLIIAVVVVGAVALITLTQNWVAVGDWFVANGPTGVIAWSLIPTALAALAGFFVLRRATPKN
jgi:hypothetical protein